MKTLRLFNIFVCALLFSGVLLAQEEANILERTALPSRTHRTWEGIYKFSEESILKISGLRDLHVLKYRREGSEGELIEFAEEDENNKLRILRETDTNVKGVTPIFEGIDVLPDDDGAEVIVRWRHPGQGGFRRVEKYRYTTTGLTLTNSSELMDLDGEKQWISENALNQKKAENNKNYPAVREATQKDVK